MNIPLIVQARLKEKSTWLAIGHGIIAASVYPYPHCFIALGISLLQAVMPEAPKVPAT